MYKKSNFRPRRYVRSFRDLEVYQRSLESSVMVLKNVLPIIDGKGYMLEDEMVRVSLDIPKLIAEAHSSRFEDEGGLGKLDESMSACNEMVVYLEQIRDIYADKTERVVLDELMRRYINNRRKIFNLYKAWKRFVDNKQKIN